jgi:hypothetical protein
MHVCSPKRRHFAGALLLLFSAAAGVSGAAEAVRWVATSTTAISITGDARFTPTRISFSGGRQLSIAYLKDVSGRVSFVGDSHAKDHATLYRVTSPFDILLKNHNPLCGQKPTYVSVMMVREASGGVAYLTVYSGAAQPTGAANDKICAGYTYSILP